MEDFSITDKQFRINLESVRNRIADACAKAGREPDTVVLLPVTKTHPAETVELTYQSGFKSVGENRVQEVQEKSERCPSSLKWELIGHLQSNKSRQAAELFDRIQSVDSIKLLRRLNDGASELGKMLRVLLQFNTGGDPGKFGAEPKDAESIIDFAMDQPQLRIEGLMTIAPLQGGNEAARRAFAGLRELRDRLEDSSGCALSELSMGMTGDLEEAILEGSTLIRIGTALFGHRD